MYLIPQPKQVKTKSGHLNAYDFGISIDPKCSYKIYLAAKDLKDLMSHKGFSNPVITKSITALPNKIQLKYESNASQAYSLSISKSGVTLIGQSEQGLFFAIQTLKQIIEANGINLPCMEITDSPDIKDRGYYLDVTRGRVPTVDGIKRFIDRCAYYKYTTFQLYIEHTFAWEGFEEAYTNQGYLTAEEILDLDEYCNERFIELVPSFATFGHLYTLLQTKSFSQYAELENYQPTVHKWQESREHHTIDVSNPASFDLIKTMLDQVIPLFRSTRFNVCCDETVDMGKGRGKALADKVGEGRMYVDYLKQLCAYLKQYGKQVMFWGDVIAENPDLATELPEDVICLMWDYNSPIKQQEKLDRLMQTSLTKYVCPWTAGAVNLIPEYHGTAYIAYENILTMAALAKDNNLDGFLLTDWGDFGHVCHAELRFPMLALGGAAAWNIERTASEVERFDAEISLREYGNTSALGILQKIAEERGFTWNNLVGDYNKRCKGEQIEPCPNLYDNYQVVYALEQKLASLDLNEAGRVILNAVKGQRLIIAIKCAEDKQVMQNEVLATELERWMEQFAAIWRKDNKEAELWRIYNFIEYQASMLR